MPKRTAHILEDKWRSDDVKLQEAADFSSLLLSERVLLGLKKAGFKTPSPIQLEAIPVGRFGSDLIVQAKSGTGKTLVFTIIALDLLQDQKQPQVLILAPTREIAFQICQVINSVGSAFKYLKCCAFIGGIPIDNDRQNIQGCQIVVGTPGRIKQLLSLKCLKPNSIHLLVLDEADQLLEQSFKADIDSIFVSLPKEKQVITTSATYPKSLKKLAARYFRENPFVARLNVNDLALLGTRHYIHIVEMNPMPVLAYRAKMRALEQVLTSVTFSQCLVFCNVLSKVESICDDIKSWGFSSTYISSVKEQAARLKAIECLKRFKCKVLVSSDITSRGIDAENVDLIINIDVPYSTEVYLHRVGRAGRYGSKGLAVSFISTNDVPSFKKIQKNGNFKTYFLPDPIPANLINQRPDPKSELFKDEDSVSESSDEELISPDYTQSDSTIIIHQDEPVSNGTRKDAAAIESKMLFPNSINDSNEKISKDNKVVLPSEKIYRSRSENSCPGELMGLFPLDESTVCTEKGGVLEFQVGAISELNNGIIGKDGDKIEEAIGTTDSIDLGAIENSNKNYAFTNGKADIQSDLVSEFGISEDSCKGKLADLVTLEQTPDKDIIGNNLSSSESLNKSEIKEDSQIPQEESYSNEAVVPSTRFCDSEETNGIEIDIDVNEDLNEIVIKNVNESLNLDEDPQDFGVDVLTVADSVSNGCELNREVELETDNLSEVLEQSSIDKGKENEVPVTTNIDINPVQVDEVTACVMNFIHNYEMKTTGILNGDTVTLKPMESNSSAAKPLVDELVSDRMGLNDYYYKVCEAYRNENITGDTDEIMEFVRKANEISPAINKNERCSIAVTKEDAIPILNKIDLNSWSKKLAGEELLKAELDSTDESTDSSSDCILESTPVNAFKAKNPQLDVSSDTPSFFNPIDDPETDGSSNSEYSNKCSKLENALRTRNGTGNKGQVASKHSSGTESTSSSSDTEDSSSSEDSAEVTLLERAHRKMVEINGEKQTLSEKAHILKNVLNGLESKIPSAQKSKESISDIQITTASHSSKVHGNESASNDKYENQCGFQYLLQGSKAKESLSKSSSSLSSPSSLENIMSAKKSTKTGCSTSKHCAKNINDCQGKYRRFSLSSETASDDSESTVSYSGASNSFEKRKRSKAAKSKPHSRAGNIPNHGFVSADQGNLYANHPPSSSHVDNSCFSHQCNFERSVHSTHEHNDSCYMPSQHQCYSLNSHSSCQSRHCAAWYDMFYRQWNFIQNSSCFQ